MAGTSALGKRSGRAVITVTNLHEIMQTGLRSIRVLAALAGVCLLDCVWSPPAGAQDSYEAQLRAERKEREKDPAWKPEQQQLATIKVGDGKQAGALLNFCVYNDGNLLACWSVNQKDEGAAPSKKKGASGNALRVYSPDGQLLKSLPLPVAPEAVCVDSEGTIYVGGNGRLLKLDQQGKVLLTVDTPASSEPEGDSKETQEMLKQLGTTDKKEAENYKRMLKQRRGKVTGIAVTTQDVFVSCPSPDDSGYCIYRLDRELANPKRVVEKLRGCCGQMDVQASGDQLWIPHNARHLVECRDREGKAVSEFGKGGRKPEQFGGCCEPKNLRLTRDGEVLAAESGPPTCIKKFSRDGKFLGVVALLDDDASCVRVSVDVSPDGKRFYLLDTEKNAIRVFGSKAP